MWNMMCRGCLGLLLTAGAAHAANPADPAKVVRVAYEAPDDGFDLVRTANAYSVQVSQAIYEPLLTYDYLASPAKLIPNTAEAMPEVTDGGKTFTFHIRKGIHFAPDAAFKGRRRELTAQDYAYTWKRFFDPQNRSPSISFLGGKIVGLDELGAKAAKSGRFDYDVPVAGIETPDPYTLRIRLKAPDYNFLYSVAYTGLGAVAREVIEAYGLQSGQHPVGTGPYMLTQYVPRSKIVLTANPEFRGFTWDFDAGADSWSQQLSRDMKGKQMPQVGRVEISIIEEEQSRWLAFQDKQLDNDKLPQSATLSALDGVKLKPAFTAQGISLYRVTEPEITYSLINQRDPLLGGATKEKIALRRAILMAYDVNAEITQLRLKQAVPTYGIVPVGVQGHDPAYRSSLVYDPVLSNKLLDRFGYKRSADGYRSLPDGKPLTIRINSQPDGASKIVAEIWKRGLDKVGIRAEFPTQSFADNLKAADQCKLMMWGSAWHADYPEGENFAQALYGPNAGQGNHSCYESAAFDALYRTMQATPPGPQRLPLYEQMTRQMEADSVWGMHVSRVRNWLVRPWVKGFRKHPFMQSEWAYIDIEKH
ncbi:MAG: ABC transporter substrate-binding protein [Herminiimonas sp.]|nr:ABC transporter substrate-binding protein [Herminiimonas sp.]